MVRSLLIAPDQRSTRAVKSGSPVPGECLLKGRWLITRGHTAIGELRREARPQSIPAICAVRISRRLIPLRYRGRLCMGKPCSCSDGDNAECDRFHSLFSASGAHQGLLNTNSEIVPSRLQADVSKRNAWCGSARLSEQRPGADQWEANRKRPAHYDALGRGASLRNPRGAAVAPYPRSDEARVPRSTQPPARMRPRKTAVLRGSLCSDELVLAVASSRTSNSTAPIAVDRHRPVNLGRR